MRLENYFFVYESALPSRICDDLIQYGEMKNAQVAKTGEFEQLDDSQTDISKLYKVRNSSIVWMEDPWIYNSIIPFVKEANRQAGWNFTLEGAESCQWTKYSETQHYTWHQDSFPKPTNRPNTWDHGLIRKLSVTVSLADGDTYTGGDLEFDLRNNSDSSSEILTSSHARKKGSIIVFPSFVWHRVTPVTKGTRYSLVIWNNGKPFV